ncbi:ADP-ribosylglycohydrolase family protein [Candidatus Woesearchaeota archaeon]|nr:ADP-ribosylglycohydrolase family protein [Candidatus Woesearchaeota archaeon]
MSQALKFWEKLEKFSWEEQLIKAKGGNTDGIAAITGAFLGAYLGVDKIPKKFMKIENKKKLIKLGKEIVNN